MAGTDGKPRFCSRAVTLVVAVQEGGNQRQETASPAQPQAHGQGVGENLPLLPPGPSGRGPHPAASITQALE